MTERLTRVGWIVISQDGAERRARMGGGPLLAGKTFLPARAKPTVQIINTAARGLI